MPVRVNTIYPDRRVLIVGLDGRTDERDFLAYTKALKDRDIKWWQGCRGIPSFEETLEIVNGCIRLEIVHVHKGAGYTSLMRDCTALAHKLAMHPKRPLLNLNGAGFNFLHATLGGYAHVRIKSLEEAAAERWKRFGPNGVVDEQF